MRQRRSNKNLHRRSQKTVDESLRETYVCYETV
jgi:hypothetical protein